MKEILINSLEPGEKAIFNYTIEGKRQTMVNLNPAKIKFYYLQEREVTSKSNLIKIITPKITQFYYIGLPVFIGIVVFIIYFWQTKKYKRKRKDYQRAEMNIFELGSREAILKVEHNLGERLNSLANKSNKEYTGIETKQ